MKMWDGRFTKPTDSLMEAFNNSLHVDRELIEEDIEGSIAWAKALCKIDVIDSNECEEIIAGLRSILDEYHNGELKFISSDEDIHMAVERLLIEKIGDSGARLHTGRSRNDQVATDFRLYVMRSLYALKNLVTKLQSTLLDRAIKEKTVIVPGYTHLQQAQPVSLAHYWLSLFFLLEREKKRLLNALACADEMPLGNGALAGSGFCVDRDFIAKELGFSEVTKNSMDGVASRDFVLEALSAIASLGIGLSRYAEDMIIWSSKEFGFIELDDAWSTGSSMMPQKKNPDSLELIRGKSGRFLGNYTHFATTLKGIGLTYFKDLQEDKEPFIDSTKQMALVLQVFIKVIDTLLVNREKIICQLDPFLLATDIADYLVRRGMPFRQAHNVVGRIVGECVRNGKDMTKLSIDELVIYSPVFKEDVLSLFNYAKALEGRDVAGGTGPKSIDAQINFAKSLIA